MSTEHSTDAAFPPSSGGEILTFGPYELLKDGGVLRESGRPVRLGSRAAHILLALLEQPGRTVSKRDLMARVWPGSLVDESNLRVHVAALRRTLGDGRGGARYIVNDAGRGYRFVAPVGRRGGAAAPWPAADPDGTTLPAPPAGLLGRDAAASLIEEQVALQRLVTIAGPGGAGKSALALTVAHRVVENGARPVIYVDLASTLDPALVPAALATAVGVSAVTDDPAASLTAFLADSRVLIVLDNCEHQIEQVALLAERLLKATAGVHILATSREPLLAAREWVHRLPPLPLPPPGAQSVEEAWSSPAVRLFVELAAAGGEAFELTGDNVEPIVRICRALDGIPLAIELVAAHLQTFGLAALAGQLDEHLLLLARGRRPARPQHQSIRAVLDWSYGTLSGPEQQLLRALAVFRGPFSVESAAAVTAGSRSPPTQLLENLLSLTDKSLAATALDDQEVLYRLLHVTRSYAMEKLIEAGEQTALLRRHAEHCCAVLERAQEDWETLTREAWLARYQAMIDDVRAALDWAFSATGDPDLAARLAVVSLPYGFQLCQIAEFQKRAELALERFSQTTPRPLVAELRLNIALGALYKNTQDSEEPFLMAHARAQELAQALGIPKYRMETLVARTVSNIEQSNMPAALQAAEELLAIAAGMADPVAQLIADHAAAQACHFAGQHARARALASRVLAHPARSIPLLYSHAAVDRRVWMRIVQARALWLEGLPDQAWALAAECLELAAGDEPFARCHALALATVPIALWRGDLAAAQPLTAELIEHCRRYTLSRWLKLALCYDVAVASRSAHSGAQLHRGAPVPFAWPANALHYDLLATVCENWVDAATIARASQGLSGWCAPEVLRVAGELTLRQGGADAAAAAEGLFQRSLQMAQEQQALSWQLRTAVSLAVLWRGQGRATEAQAALAAVTDRFREGLATADVSLALSLLGHGQIPSPDG